MLPQTQVAGVTEPVTISFVPTTRIPNGGIIRITFAPDFGVTSPTPTPQAFTGFTGGSSLSCANYPAGTQVVMCTSSDTSGGAAAEAASSCSITIANIANPTRRPSTGPFLIETFDSNDTPIDYGTAASIKIYVGTVFEIREVSSCTIRFSMRNISSFFDVDALLFFLMSSFLAISIYYFRYFPLQGWGISKIMLKFS